MHFLEYYYKNVIKQDLLNKFFYKNISELPEIEKIILNFKNRNTRIKNFASVLLALELISTKKGLLTKIKKPNLFLKIQKGKPSGCKIVLEKTLMYNFLNKILVEISPNIKKFIIFKINSQNYKNFSFNLESKKLLFSELKENYQLLRNLSYLNITIIANVKTRKEMFFLIRSFSFPLKTSKKIQKQI